MNKPVTLAIGTWGEADTQYLYAFSNLPAARAFVAAQTKAPHKGCPVTHWHVFTTGVHDKAATANTEHTEFLEA